MNPKRNRRTRKEGHRKNAGSIVFTRKFITTRAKVGADTGTYLGFNCSQFLNSDIVSTFQEFRIKSLRLSWVLVNAPNNNANFPTLYVAPQHISLGNPTSRDEVIQYKGVKHYQFGPANLEYSQTYVPYVPLLNNSSASAGRQFQRSPWISTVTDLVTHYVAVDWLSRYNAAPDSSHTIELIVSAVIECRGTR
jgi:hypothetical protein